jgi:hypothetical protein
MGKKRLRNWILNNEFFQTKGQFSKSAFIMMNTWVLVIMRYAFSGISVAGSIAEKTVGNHQIPAWNWAWTVNFDYGAAMALLTTVFGLYFGNKFSPGNKESGNGSGEQRDLKKDDRGNDNARVCEDGIGRKEMVPRQKGGR